MSEYTNENNIFYACSLTVHYFFTVCLLCKNSQSAFAGCIKYGSEIGVFIIESKVNNADNYLSAAYIEKSVEKYSKMLFRLCFTLLRDYDDSEDAVQETFIRLMTKAPRFINDEHEKAWLIRVSTNICKNINKFNLRRSSLSLEEIREIGVSEEDSGVFDAIMSLPSKYKIVMDLHYIEGYTASEISEIIGINADAVRKRMQTGRNKLRKIMESDFNDE